MWPLVLSILHDTLESMRTTFKIAFILIVFVSVHAQELERPLRIAMPSSQFAFHPHLADTSIAHQIFTGLFDTLVNLNPETLFPEPGLAEAWSFSNNGQTLSINLRRNLKWSNGDTLTAQDVIESWFALIDPQSKSTWVSMLSDVQNVDAFREGRIRDRNQVGISAQDNRITIRLKRPSPHFITVLAHYSLAPIHASMRRQAAPNPLSMPVSGPYRIESFTPARLVMVKNENHWEKDEVLIRRIDIQFTDDEDTVSRAYSRGEIDWLDHIVNPELILNRDDIKFNPSYSVSYLFFNAKNAPYNDERVRRALVLLLDHDALREEEVFATQTLVPPIPPYPAVTGIKAANKNEADRLLQSAGYPRGRGLPPIRLVLPQSEYFKRRVNILEKSWDGYVKVDPIFIPWPEFYDRIKTENFTLSFHSWIGDFPDPFTFLILFEASSSLNIANLQDREYNDFLNQARTKLEAEARFQIYSQAELRLLNSGAVIPLSFGYSVHVLDTNFIAGWAPNLLDFHPYKKIRFLGNRLGPNLTLR